MNDIRIYEGFHKAFEAVKLSLKLLAPSSRTIMVSLAPSWCYYKQLATSWLQHVILNDFLKSLNEFLKGYHGDPLCFCTQNGSLQNNVQSRKLAIIG